MHAIAVTDFGAPPQLTDLPEPEPGPGQVVVRIAAAGLNPFDWQLADGLLQDSAPAVFPLVMGTDGAGVVTAVGPGAARFAVGDEVYGQFSRPAAGGGSYAGYAVADADSPIAAKPKTMGLPESAGVPTAAMTALTMLDAAGVEQGHWVLILGATGGVGTFAVQLAHARGANVIATAQGDASAMMHELGAAETVDHTGGSVGDMVLDAHEEGIDAILHLVRDGDSLDDAALALRPGGIALSSTYTADIEGLKRRGFKAADIENTPSPQLLARLAKEIDAGRLVVAVDAAVPLAEAPAAIERSRAGHARGKTILLVEQA